MEQLRMVDSAAGIISYTLARKRVKNWNLRVREGRVFLSVPLRIDERQADEFVRSRRDWILRVLERQSRAERMPLEELARDVCVERLNAALDRVYPLAAALGVPKPQLRLRRMKSQWGNCHYRQGYITLNTALASCPDGLQDYVALHELVHFIHHNHGTGFYAVMDMLMPDWKQRRGALKGCQL